MADVNQGRILRALQADDELSTFYPQLLRDLTQQYPLAEVVDKLEAAQAARTSVTFQVLHRGLGEGLAGANFTQEIRNAASGAAHDRMLHLMLGYCSIVFMPFSTYTSFANAVMVVAVLFITLSYPGFGSAPGGSMPQGYTIPNNSNTTDSCPGGLWGACSKEPWKAPGATPIAASMAFWYFNALGFFSAIVALCFAAYMSVSGMFIGGNPVFRTRSMYCAGWLLAISAMCTVAAFCCAAFVSVPMRHAVIIMLMCFTLSAASVFAFWYYVIHEFPAAMRAKQQAAAPPPPVQQPAGQPGAQV